MLNNFVNNFFLGLSSTQKGLVVAIAALIIYIVSASASYAIVAGLQGKGGLIDLATSVPTPPSGLEENPNEPKTEECPLDGVMHTKKAKEAWGKRRPLGVMIENHQESRPQSGLSVADVVYEAVAEGGITRFMAVYLCNLGDVQVGPVRSARTYYLDWLSEYDALYAHVGGANTPGPANALGQIIDYKIKDLNQFSIGFPTFWRDYQRLGHAVATEHTMYSTTYKLWDVGAKRGWSNIDQKGVKWDVSFVPWKFKDDQGGGSVSKINVDFWGNQRDYSIEWNYDATCNCYKRKNGGNEHKDLNNDQQLSPKNIIIRFQNESRANDGYPGNVHILYGNKGQGTALIFQDGKVIKGRWVKQTRVAREKFLDEKGQEVQLNRGQIWLQTVPDEENVKY
ncbi:DUF3048 domain-containing protein [Candidatus Daviesbacteria bacterium]|nr:DUF3048 domain-containing protein [Candidatus Daviesbacteria bacterium]